MEQERYYKRNNNEILVEQGDIFTNINMEIFTKKSKNANQEEIIWSNVLVVSQSCDLHREQENKKELPSNEILSVLVVPIFNLSDFQKGTHLTNLGKDSEEVTNRMLGRISLSNRYQILKLRDDEKLQFKIEDSILDFRYYFTVPIIKLKRENYLFSLHSPYIEKITQSFAHYISRIPLPIELDVS